MSSLVVALICLVFCGLNFLRPVPQILFVIFSAGAAFELFAFFVSLFPRGSSRLR